MSIASVRAVLRATSSSPETAATDPRRSSAYRSHRFCVDYFSEAAARYRNATPDTVKWGTRIEDDDQVMALIPVEAVTAQVDAAMTAARR